MNIHKALPFVLLCLAPAIFRAQNVVPNPGFETLKKTPCSFMANEMDEYVNDWECVADGTSDILNDAASSTCYANCHSSNPASLGSQTPHGGHGMALVMTEGHSGSYREYIGVTLSTPLVPGKKYYAEMYVSLADYVGYATNNIGMAFFTGPLYRRDGMKIIAEPQVNSTAVIDDASGWVKVSSTFTAAEAYTHLIIGNFLTTDQTTMKKRPSSGGTHYGAQDVAAYYIDDITVRPASSDLIVSGDTLVTVGATAVLTAKGSKTFAWADSAKPKVILGRDAEFKALQMTSRRTFIVYGDNGLVTTITVNVIKPQPQYIQTLEGRKVKKGRTIEVHNEKIVVTVYDNNKIDGDSISLYYGDSCIVSNYKLTGKKKSFTINIDKAHPKQLILYAVNQGTMPPNTAAVTVGDGRNETNVVLSSDMKNCDSVMLVYKDE